MIEIVDKDSYTSSISGLIIGFLSGMIGIGGGEYRAPVLLYLLKLSAKFAIAANLLIGLFTVTASFIKRIDQVATYNILVVSAVFIATSIIGSYLGALYTKRFKDQTLVRILGGLLILAAFKVFFDSGKAYNGDFSITILSIALVLIVGFIIGIFSGFLGVAGGEFRIPALLLIFGISIKLAGAINLLVSIPTVLVGFLKHKNMGHVDNHSLKIAVLMGIFSVIGALIGATLVYLMTDKTLLIILSVIMLLAGIKMAVKP